MKITCAPRHLNVRAIPADLGVVLYSHADIQTLGSVGAAVQEAVATRQLAPAPRAWDFLSTAMSAVTADLAGHRARSPDGWTREYDLTVAVSDAAFWNTQATLIAQLLNYLTTDRWRIYFIDGGHLPRPPQKPTMPSNNCVALLSGGLDSLIGAIDLTAIGRTPFVVSELVRGDAEKQRDFAAVIGGGLTHLQLHHNATVPDPETPTSQRARSIIFLAYGVLAATSLGRYHGGGYVDLNICENGFIAINPPLTHSRVGSLSTRTTHPIVLALFQTVLNNAGVRVNVVNPYRLKTKGEMLVECRDKPVINRLAHTSTSCGRFLRYNYQHCGRCVTCPLRRASFQRWGVTDATTYKFADLSRLDADHAEFDDVRSAAIAVLEREERGTSRWLGASLASSLVVDQDELIAVVERGLGEIGALLNRFSVT